MPVRSRRTLGLMAVSLILFTGLAVLSNATLRSVEHETEARARAREGLITSARLLAALVDIETGQRGYLLTGDRAYLEPYDDGLRRYRPLALELESLAREYPAIDRHMRGLEPLMKRRVYLAQRNVAVRASADFDAGEVPLLALEGKQVMDALRGHIGTTERLLREEIKRRDAAVSATTRSAFIAEVALGVLGALVLLGSMLVLRAEQNRRVRAEDELQRANRDLEDRVRERTAELEQARSQIEAFALQLDRGIEGERRRLARDVHDQLGQVFTALKLTWGQLQRRGGLAMEESGQVDRLLDDGIVISRRIASELRPPLLDDLGLAAALEHRCETFGNETGIECAIDVADSERLDREQAMQLYRIVQEALTNVARHAQAHSVWIHGEAMDSTYELAVEDDGRGIDGMRPGSTGMSSMRERAALAGGHLDLERSLKGGVRVRVSLPLGDADA